MQRLSTDSGCADAHFRAVDALYLACGVLADGEPAPRFCHPGATGGDPDAVLSARHFRDPNALEVSVDAFLNELLYRGGGSVGDAAGSNAVNGPGLKFLNLRRYGVDAPPPG